MRGGVNLNEMTTLFGLELILERREIRTPEVYEVFSLGKLFNFENSKNTGPHRIK